MICHRSIEVDEGQFGRRYPDPKRNDREDCEDVQVCDRGLRDDDRRKDQDPIDRPSEPAECEGGETQREPHVNSQDEGDERDNELFTLCQREAISHLCPL